MTRSVDFHSHILPGIDDGSPSVEVSIAMLQMEAAQGIQYVVATPHFYAHHDNLDRFLENRAKSERMLREEMAKHTDLPELIIGAEVHFFSGMDDSRAISSLTIGSTNYILIEMPHPPWPEEMYRKLERIYENQGLIPIMAHVDRYIGRFRTFGIPKRLAELPVLVQANAEFFLEKGTMPMALRMLRRGDIHLLGSDCHNLSSRKPNLGDAVKLIETRLGETAISKMNKLEHAVLLGKNPYYPHTGVKNTVNGDDEK